MGSIKTIGTSGQLSLGKKFAGQQMLVDEIEPGVWILKVGRFIPENDLWLRILSLHPGHDSAYV